MLNRNLVEYIMRMGLATDCRITPRSILARKNYFYPDLPKGYQISQYEEPICVDGHLEVELEGGATDQRAHQAHPYGRGCRQADP